MKNLYENSYKLNMTSLRSSRLQMFFKIGPVINFAIFKGNHMCWSHFLIKLQATLLKKRLQYRYVPGNIAKFLRTAFVTEHFWWLLLISVYFSPSTRNCTAIAEKNVSKHIMICKVCFFLFYFICRRPHENPYLYLYHCLLFFLVRWCMARFMIPPGRRT